MVADLLNALAGCCPRGVEKTYWMYEDNIILRLCLSLVNMSRAWTVFTIRIIASNAFGGMSAERER